MVDTAVAITPGAGTNIDTRTEATNGNHRQVIVVGDPSTNAGVAPVDATNGLSVNVTNASLTVGTHAVTQSGAWTVQPGNTANTTPWLSKLHDGTNAVTVTDAAPSASAFGLVVAIHPDSVNANGRAAAASSAPVALSNEDKVALADDAAFTPGTSNVNMAGFQADETATDSVDEGDAGAARMTLDRKQIMTLQPHTAGGLSIFRSLDLDETEEDVKTSAGCLYKLRITNRTTSARYVKLYNAAAAAVTVGTTTPIDTIVVPGGGSADLATVITENFGGLGLTFDTALSLAATTGFADNDTGAPGANDVIVSAYYK